MRQPIIVGIDVTEASDDAVIQAAERAARDRVPLTVVHAVSPALWGAPPERDALSGMRRALRSRVAALTGRRENSFEVIVESGAPHAVLSRIAALRGATLVVGNHIERRFGHAFMRDLPERLATQARPVYVAQPMTGAHRVLVALASPVDDSVTLDAGIEEARSSGSLLVVVHSVHKGFLEMMAQDLVNGGAYAPHPMGKRSQVVKAREELRRELMRRGVTAEVHVVDGSPELMIPEVAVRTDVGLIVVGSPPRPAPLARVALAVLRHATCSVLVVDSGAESGEAIETTARRSVGLVATARH